MRVENILIRKIDLLSKTGKKNGRYFTSLLDYEVEGKSKQFRSSLTKKTGWIHRYNQVKFLKGKLYRGALVLKQSSWWDVDAGSTRFILKLEKGGKVMVNGLVLDLSPNYYEIKLQIEKNYEHKGFVFANRKTRLGEEPPNLWEFVYKKSVVEGYGRTELEDSIETESLFYQMRKKNLGSQKSLHLVYFYEKLEGCSRKKVIADQQVMLVENKVSQKNIKDWILVQSPKFRKIKYQDILPKMELCNRLISGEFSSTDCLELLSTYYPTTRNYLIDRVGFKQFFEILNYEVISSNEKEELIEIENGLKFIKHSNYCVEVSKEITTIKEALDWSFGLA